MKLLFNLAKNSIKRNRDIYIPYIVTLIISAMLFFLISNFNYNDMLNFEIDRAYIQSDDGLIIQGIGGGYDQLKKRLIDVGLIMILINLFFNLYANMFINKRREREYGLYDILGLDKKHIMKLMLLENIIINSFAITVGILMGITLNKLNFLVLSKLLSFGNDLTTEINIEAVIITCVIFFIICAISSIVSLIRIYKEEGLSLLKGKKNIIHSNKYYSVLTFLGVILIGLGYYFSYTKNYSANYIVSENEIFLKFYEVLYITILLFVGTYLMFKGSTVLILNGLKKRDKIYKRKKNFIAISNLIYRFKTNALSLTIITLLSTMFLVFLFTSILSYKSYSKSNKEMDLNTISHNVKDSNTVNEFIKNKSEEADVPIERYYNFEMLKADILDDSTEIINGERNSDLDISIIKESEYNAITKENVNISRGETIILGNEIYYGKEMKENLPNDIRLYDNELKVRDIKDISSNIQLDYEVYSYLLVVKDELYSHIKSTHRDDLNVSIVQNYIFEGSNKEIKSFLMDMDKNWSLDDMDNYWDYNIDIETVDEVSYHPGSNYMSFLVMISGSFLIGYVNIAAIFLVNLLMVIYYKQYLEGFEDVKQWEKLQRVGLTNRETKKTVKKQIRIFFFLPLVISIIHFIFIIGVVSNIITYIDINSIVEFIKTYILTIIIFIIIYFITYMITSKKYYGILLRQGVVGYGENKKYNISKGE